MLTLTDTAKEQLDAYFAENNVESAPIRLYVGGGCSGPQLALGLDNPNAETDTVIEEKGYTFVVENDLLEHAKPVTINVTPMGLSIESSLQFEQAEGGCGSGCSGCG
jgi:Fe-S cluster assembly iron-binding protein IscA